MTFKGRSDTDICPQSELSKAKGRDHSEETGMCSEKKKRRQGKRKREVKEKEELTELVDYCE